MLKNSIGGKIAAGWLGVVLFCAIFGPLLPVAKVGQTFNDGLQFTPFTNCKFMGPLSRTITPLPVDDYQASATTQTTLATQTPNPDITKDTIAGGLVPLVTVAAPSSLPNDEEVFTEESLPPDLSSSNTISTEDSERERLKSLEETQSSKRCFFLGSTTEGTDLLSGIVNGARTSISISFISVLLGGIIGSLMGIASAYQRGWFDRLILIVFNVLLSIPTLVLAFALIAIFATPINPSEVASSSSRLRVLIGSLVIIIIPQLGRVARAAALQWINRDFVIASQSIGASRLSILFKRIIPNVLPSIFAILFLALGTVVVVEGSLSLLGVGLQDGNSWGSLLARNSSDFSDYPHLMYVPVATIAFTVISTNKIGDLIRQSLDKREAKI